MENISDKDVDSIITGFLSYLISHNKVKIKDLNFDFNEAIKEYIGIGDYDNQTIGSTPKKKNIEEAESTSLKSDGMKFKVGDRVYKPKGYKFPGTVVSVFKTTPGYVRVVAELIDNGMLHIFSESQLEKEI